MNVEMTEAELRALRRAAFDAMTGGLDDWAKPMAAALKRAHTKLSALLAPPVTVNPTKEHQENVDAAMAAFREWRENPPEKGFEATGGFQALILLDGDPVAIETRGPYKNLYQAQRMGKSYARRILQNAIIEKRPLPTLSVQAQQLRDGTWVNAGEVLTDMRAK